MTPEQRKSVLAGLNSRSIDKVWEAGQAIWADPDPALLRGMIWTLRHGRAEHNRVEAAYGLRIMPGRAGVATCECVLSNKSESTHVRAYVAETLADRRRPASHNVLLRNLKSPSAEIRFWCAFGLGQMRERKALPMLRWLADTDHRVVRGWWAVSRESRDAIAEIESKTRRGWQRCMFCPR
jgi:hypothetical protein